MSDFNLIHERVETIRRELSYLETFMGRYRLAESLAESNGLRREAIHLINNFGFIFRCSSGPFHVEEFMIEDFSDTGETRLIARRDTALLLDETMAWFPTPEIAAHAVETLEFDFPSPLVHVFMRTPICEIQVRIRERQRQIATLQQIIEPSRN